MVETETDTGGALRSNRLQYTDLAGRILASALAGGLLPGNGNKLPTHIRPGNALSRDAVKVALDPDKLIKCNLDNTFCVRADYKLGRRIKPELSLAMSERFAHFKERFHAGWTLASDGVERVSCEALALCQQVSDTFGYVCRANLYVTPPDTRGFPPHFDAHDVFVMHIMGRKTWVIETTRRAIPRRQTPSPPDVRIDGGFMTVVMEPGDILFIPKGHVHVVDNQSEGIGAQLTLACTSLSIEDVVLRCVADEVEKHACLQENFPSFESVGDTETVKQAIRILMAGLSNADIDLVVRRMRHHHFQQSDKHSVDDLLSYPGTPEQIT